MKRQPWKIVTCANDNLPLRKGFKTTPPFLSLYKIQPSEGEVKKYMKLQKVTGFQGLNTLAIKYGKQIEAEPKKQYETNPGRPVTLQDLKDVGEEFSVETDD